jgi:hypothetical protein
MIEVQDPSRDRYMLRSFGIFGMAAVFLLISPALRETVMKGFSNVVILAIQHSPYSYILLGLAFFGGAMLTFGRTPRPQ